MNNEELNMLWKYIDECEQKIYAENVKFNREKRAHERRVLAIEHHIREAYKNIAIILKAGADA